MLSLRSNLTLKDLSQGSRIAFIRYHRGMPQHEVADMLGVKHDNKRRIMTRYEKGQRNPKEDRTRETARNFEFVSPQWYQFMQSRAEIPYYKLKMMDTFNPIIAQLRQHYGISRKLDLPIILNNFGRKR